MHRKADYETFSKIALFVFAFNFTKYQSNACPVWDLFLTGHIAKILLSLLASAFNGQQSSVMH